MIEVTKVVKRYGATTVLNEATFRVATAQLTTIVGPSGCGKSTMLRCLNRLERFDAGRIKVEDVELHGTAAKPLSPADQDTLVHRVRIRVGLVFQNFNLFPHLTALGNVTEAPMTVKKMNRAQADAIGRHYMNRVGLSGKEDHCPAQLSGGQQQRVAIARALPWNPRCSCSTSRPRRSIPGWCATWPSCSGRSTISRKRWWSCRTTWNSRAPSPIR